MNVAVSTGASLIILIVEDEDDHAEIIDHFIERELPNSIRERVSFLKQAEEWLTQRKPDIIFLDFTLPDHPGGNPVALLREIAAETPIVVLTSRSDVESGIESLRLGAQDFLSKSEMGSVCFARTIKFALERRHILKQLEARQKSLESVVFALSHELSAPPRQILYLTEHLRETCPGSANAAVIDDIRACAERMSQLVLGAKALAGFGAQETRRAQTDAHELISSCTSRLAKADQRRISLSGTASLEVDPRLFGILIDNLLSNALKYSPPESTIEVVVGNDPEPWVSVSDHGRGMSQGSTTQAFLPGVRCTHEGDDTPGSGFGLAICRQIVQMHGGDIDVCSEVGKGSTFRASFPISPRLARQGETQPQADVPAP